jgi:hypothetical protein
LKLLLVTLGEHGAKYYTKVKSISYSWFTHYFILVRTNGT